MNYLWETEIERDGKVIKEKVTCNSNNTFKVAEQIKKQFPAQHILTYMLLGTV